MVSVVEHEYTYYQPPVKYCNLHLIKILRDWHSLASNLMPNTCGWQPSADKQPVNDIHPQVFHRILSLINLQVTQQEETEECNLLLYMCVSTTRARDLCFNNCKLKKEFNVISDYHNSDI
jgi:hypothetical protein